MSQQINLLNEQVRKRSKTFSALNMLQALAFIFFCLVLVYAYLVYQGDRLNSQLEADSKSLVSEQARLVSLAAEYSRQRAGVTLDQELKNVMAEAAAQKAIISALKNGVIGNTTGYSRYMQAFARQVVNGLWLTGFSIEGDAAQMNISGASLSPELVPGYLMRLNNESAIRGKTFASLQMHMPKEETGKPEKKYLEFVLKSVDKDEADK